jgi:hypothetical protein
MDTTCKSYTFANSSAEVEAVPVIPDYSFIDQDSITFTSSKVAGKIFEKIALKWIITVAVDYFAMKLAFIVSKLFFDVRELSIKFIILCFRSSS